ncbi:MAG: TonB-dependent receptor [Acidobacteria bacterium]|nr:TonB-dependent receptor [Acidobacteriota bacterium]
MILYRCTILTALALTVLLGRSQAYGQTRRGLIRGIVTDPKGELLPGARIVLENPTTGQRTETRSDDHSEFAFESVRFDPYTLRVSSPGFQPVDLDLVIRSSKPVLVNVRLGVAPAKERVTIEAGAGLVKEPSSSTETKIDGIAIRRSPGATNVGHLQHLLARVPGCATENNGLLHFRGVDDGILYIIDGIPTVDRRDFISANTFETEAVRFLEVITGNIPAEFGGRSGAVVTLEPKSAIDLPVSGAMSLGAGSFKSGEAVGTVAGGLKGRIGFLAVGSSSRSDRFLDPVDPRNLHNHGGTVKLNLRADWHPTDSDTVLFNGSFNRSDFNVPNRILQELAGQRQRQELRDNSQSLGWIHTWTPSTVSHLAYYRHAYHSRLFGSPFDTPIFTEQDRRHVRQGFIGSVTHQYRGHTLKAGVEVSRVTPREFFTFAVTAAGPHEDEAISDAAAVFTPERPFVFHDRRVRGQVSGYFQDSFSPVRNLSVAAGVRYDHSNLLTSDQQLSPRVGAVYYLAGSHTAIRCSYNRMFMPAQVENLLLASSEQARRLSPFTAETGEGGAPIHPERMHAFEAGFSQDLFGILKLDSAYWWRFFRNVNDPNILFAGTVIFPNSVAKGMAKGIEVRVDVQDYKGFSAYFSYTNSRVLQTGPVNGGLFLTDDVIEIGPGTRFIPDHDQRNVGSFGVTYYHRGTGLWASFFGRHESGVPLEVDEDRLVELRGAPGSDLVDFHRQRVKPWTVFGISAGADLFSDERVTTAVQFNIENIADRQFAYNFGNPFEGTHFGAPRMWSARLRLTFH